MADTLRKGDKNEAMRNWRESRWQLRFMIFISTATIWDADEDFPDGQRVLPTTAKLSQKNWRTFNLSFCLDEVPLPKYKTSLPWTSEIRAFGLSFCISKTKATLGTSYGAVSQQNKTILNGPASIYLFDLHRPAADKRLMQANLHSW